MPSKVRATKTSVTSKSGKSKKKTTKESEDEPSDHYRQSKLESTMLFVKHSVDSSSTTPPASPIKKSVVIQENDDDDHKLPTPVSPGGSDRSYVTVTASNPSSPVKQAPVKSKSKLLNNKHIGNVNAICSKLNKSMNRSLHCASPIVMSRKKTTLTAGASDRKITDFFQVRKSSRKCKSDLEKEKQSQIEEAIRQGREEGLEVRTLDTKGRAIFATKPFARGEFVCEYAGELVPYKLAKKREEAYMRDPNIGCYMYFFEYKSTKHCVDATAESTRLGRLLNHSKLDGNCQTKIFEIKGRPHLILVAARDIKPGEEMTYDYGDRNQASLDAHPWLAT